MKIGEKNPLIHKNPFGYCRPAIRILQVNYSHSFSFSFQTGKNGLRRYSERGVFYQIYTLILLIGNSPFIFYSKSVLHYKWCALFCILRDYFKYD